MKRYNVCYRRARIDANGEEVVSWPRLGRAFADDQPRASDGREHITIYLDAEPLVRWWDGQLHLFTDNELQ